MTSGCIDLWMMTGSSLDSQAPVAPPNLPIMPRLSLTSISMCLAVSFTRCGRHVHLFGLACANLLSWFSLLTSQVAPRRICFLPLYTALVCRAADIGRLFTPLVGSPQLLQGTQWCSTAHPEHYWCMEAIDRQLQGTWCWSVFWHTKRTCVFI